MSVVKQYFVQIITIHLLGRLDKLGVLVYSLTIYTF